MGSVFIMLGQLEEEKRRIINRNCYSNKMFQNWYKRNVYSKMIPTHKCPLDFLVAI